ncbi:MAG: hypothetical protein ACYC2H_01055 [Thermoplasmatota archaeon]
MATFTGTFDEFYQWANARTRFWIKEETQGKRRKAGKCARCTIEGNLTSAHITSLKEVIRNALGVIDDKQQHTFDLDDAWAKIKAGHRPFEKAFQYICLNCHKIIDAKPSTSPPVSTD